MLSLIKVVKSFLSKILLPMKARKSFRAAKNTVFAIVTVIAYLCCAAAAQTPGKTVATIKSIVQKADDRTSYVQAYGTIEASVTNSPFPSASTAMIDRLVDAARQMAGPNPTDSYKLAAIRRAIYVAGPWNYNRAFSYDLSDPFGKVPANRLLSTYIRTRKGNCVSMPILFLIVADRMGLNVHLATAPLHIFVRYTDPQGVDHNLETTSGGHEARTEWMRGQMPMSDKAIASGIYMRTLSKRESVAEMATIVMDDLFGQQRFGETIEVADAILSVNPREAYVMARKASAFAALMKVEFVDKYANPALIPPTSRSRYGYLAYQNRKAFADAEALGWEPVE